MYVCVCACECVFTPLVVIPVLSCLSGHCDEKLYQLHIIEITNTYNYYYGCTYCPNNKNRNYDNYNNIFDFSLQKVADTASVISYTLL